ncbi:MAG: ABC transporter permease, partial [Gemmatimonadota bacterium]
MNGLLQDLRWTLRQLRRERLATAAILATLGLGVGANSAIFGLADAVLLRPLRSVVEPERLLSVFAADERRRHRSFVYSDYVDLREQNRSFRGLAAWVGSELAARTADRAEWVSGVLVSDDYFSVLGVRPVAGRAFLAGETERADDAIAVVAEGFA